MVLETVFESAELEVVFQAGASDFLLITFSALDFSTQKDAFWGRYFSEKAGFSAIGFVARRNNWYPSSEMQAAKRAIEPLLRKFEARITYGSSMGAYGAVKYSSLLGAKACAAFSPQVSLDPSDGVSDSVYTRWFRPDLHSRMLVKGPDVCEKPFIFFDPVDAFDKQNANFIASIAPQTSLITLPYAGHECIKVVAGVRTTAELLKTCLYGSNADVRRLCRKLRAVSPARYSGLAIASLGRRQVMAERLIERYGHLFDKKQMSHVHDKMAEVLAKRGELMKARDNSLRSLDLLPGRPPFVQRLKEIEARIANEGSL